MMGSPIYMAPEQMRSARTVDARADIWGLGVLLFELLTGEPPFDAQTIGELCARVLQDPAPRVSERRGGLPAGLDVVVGRCLEKDPAARYANVADFAIALAPFGSAIGRACAERAGRILRHHGESLTEVLAAGLGRLGSGPPLDAIPERLLPYTALPNDPLAWQRSSRAAGSSTRSALKPPQTKPRRSAAGLAGLVLAWCVVASIASRWGEPARASTSSDSPPIAATHVSPAFPPPIVFSASRGQNGSPSMPPAAPPPTTGAGPRPAAPTLQPSAHRPKGQSPSRGRDLADG
jgi:serine/threonine-protein kinase